VQHFDRVDQIKTCHVLFIAGTDRTRTRQALAALGQRSILTVSDIAGFTQSYGGMVQLFPDQNKIKVRINHDAASAAGLTLDARLLRMAEVVRIQ
jgi:hypothetical protein